ncbi:MAG TPA: hypothetical protein VMF32_25945 [Xanthobacteraceae bacterium]|nr:hypothetical protein [Xanthobacteraceae bacterium]
MAELYEQSASVKQSKTQYYIEITSVSMLKEATFIMFTLRELFSDTVP